MVTSVQASLPSAVLTILQCEYPEPPVDVLVVSRTAKFIMKQSAVGPDEMEGEEEIVGLAVGGRLSDGWSVVVGGSVGKGM